MREIPPFAPVRHNDDAARQNHVRRIDNRIPPSSVLLGRLIAGTAKLSGNCPTASKLDTRAPHFTYRPVGSNDFADSSDHNVFRVAVCPHCCRATFLAAPDFESEDRFPQLFTQ
jgi:hypothetical protein